jgi:hypothetical protein
VDLVLPHIFLIAASCWGWMCSRSSRCRAAPTVKREAEEWWGKTERGAVLRAVENVCGGGKTPRDDTGATLRAAL